MVWLNVFGGLKKRVLQKACDETIWDYVTHVHRELERLRKPLISEYPCRCPDCGEAGVHFCERK